ncbi:tetratricopeptide repeat protein [Micromonospora sp. NPDC051196]|uniref:serine/threonine-protein kinase n=1 Tax=Micromonospora sp. NPDC051196 TaxID=3155281 RepID=UPI003419DA41
MTCTRTIGCPGSVDETGYCERCGLSPAAPPVATGQPDRSPVARADSRDSWMVASLVSLPVLTFHPEHAATQSLRVPEEARFCAKGHPVGRSRGGRPGLDEGFCPHCRTPFSFLPGLRPGVVVADRYEVVRCLARGGQGWIYLARDTHQDHIEVALKGVLHANDEKALAAAVQERQFLNSLDHPNIVRSIDFALHDDPMAGPTGYIVMDYLDGMSLRRLLSAAKDPRQPEVTLPLDHILAYGHEILAALDYLHRRGLLYTDMKPDNVMRTADRIKVIDLGGVRREDGGYGGLVGSPDFLVGMEELQTRGATARSDLFALGRTLAELFTHHTPAPDTPGAAGDALGVESFRRLVARAAHPDWTRRFATAKEMSEQLLGVLREIVAGTRDQRQPEPVSLFQPSARLLDAGLGLVPPLHTWTGMQDRAWLDTGCPTAWVVALGLPVPRPDPDDPAAGELATIDAPDAQSLLNKLTTVRHASVEVELRRCRAHLELADPRAAVDALTGAATLLGPRAEVDWRFTWHRALIALAADRIGEASREFDAVYADIPGEIAPKLALGYCAERDGDGVLATRYYTAVWRRDPFQASAAFGLARLRLTATDRAGAVAILDEVPALSRHHDAARIAAVRVLASRLAGGLPGVADLNEAVRRLALLHLDGGERNGESRDRLTAAIREAVLDLIRSGNATGLARGRVLGTPPTERGVRELLDRSYRALAQQAHRAEEHNVLIDRANLVRPRTRW